MSVEQINQIEEINQPMSETHSDSGCGGSSGGESPKREAMKLNFQVNLGHQVAKIEAEDISQKQLATFYIFWDVVVGWREIWEFCSLSQQTPTTTFF